MFVKEKVKTPICISEGGVTNPLGLIHITNTVFIKRSWSLQLHVNTATSTRLLNHSTYMCLYLQCEALQVKEKPYVGKHI